MNWKRSLAAPLLAGAVLLSPAAAASVTVHIDGARLTVPAPFVEDGTTYVPLRAAAQCLENVEVEWRDGTAWVTSSSLRLSARPGEQCLEANGRCFYAPGGVRLVEGSTMVPVRALAAAMGAQVEWDGETRTVTVSSGAGTPEEGGYTEEDLYWLSRIISAESQGEPLLGKLAVGTVVLNRVASGEFPDSIYDVIFDRQWGVQFTPVANGTVYDEPTQESVAAAKMVLEGARAAGDSLYFLDPQQTDNHWTIHNREYVTTIGCHQFYL